MVNDGPSSDIFVVGGHTRGNSGLRRSYITDSKGERKIVKISVVGNIGSGAQTYGASATNLFDQFLVAMPGYCPGIAGVLTGHLLLLRNNNTLHYAECSLRLCKRFTSESSHGINVCICCLSGPVHAKLLRRKACRDGKSMQT